MKRATGAAWRKRSIKKNVMFAKTAEQQDKQAIATLCHDVAQKRRASQAKNFKKARATWNNCVQTGATAKGMARSTHKKPVPSSPIPSIPPAEMAATWNERRRFFPRRRDLKVTEDV